MEWFAGQGATICVPVGHSPDWDFVAVLDERPLRIQVKTSICYGAGRWRVQLCKRGGNRSWTGTVKHLDPWQCDFLFVAVGDGRRWCIPSRELGGSSQIVLGGPKYGEFEVEAGQPLPARTPEETASRIDPPDPRGDVRAAKGDAL
jgi:hypothetical protein